MRLLAIGALIAAALGTATSDAAKDPKWIPGTVTAVEHVTRRIYINYPSSNYTIHTEAVDYTLEHAAKSYFSTPPVDLVKIGDSVKIAVLGKNYAILKTETVEKRLKIAKTAIVPPKESIQ